MWPVGRQIPLSPHIRTESEAGDTSTCRKEASSPLMMCGHLQASCRRASDAARQLVEGQSFEAGGGRRAPPPPVSGLRFANGGKVFEAD